MTCTTITPLSAPLVDDSARVLATAFETDPLHCAAYGADVRARSERFYRARLSAESGQWCVACRGGEVVGVAHWGRHADCASRAVVSDGQAFRQLPWWDRVAGTVFRWLTTGADVGADAPAMSAPQPVTLGPLAVLPAVQGLGIGRLLMHRFCADLDREQDAGYLETTQPANVAFYERFGFSILDEIHLRGVVCVAMGRPAASRAARPSADARSLRG